MGLKVLLPAQGSAGVVVFVEIRPKWDWKPTAANRTELIHPGWNQTKMGLKVCIFTGIVSCELWVEIRPKWDWKIALCNSLLPHTMFLVEIRPKWDWKSIFVFFILFRSSKLKSDQNGIERKFAFVPEVCRVPVEIRPKWDWKNANRILWSICKWQLKSDQNGIESASSFSNTSTILTVEIRPKWDWKKTTTLGNPSLPLIVEIRPKWDWKPYLILSTIRHLTLVEIRPKWDWKFLLLMYNLKTQTIVEIRPKWDWKRDINTIYWACPDGLKSDQNGIERQTTYTTGALSRNSWNQTKMGLKVRTSHKLVLDSVAPKLKSDQNGIERRTTISAWWKLIWGWNQTKMGLKERNHQLQLQLPMLRWNQTKMGLKEDVMRNAERRGYALGWNQTKMGLKANYQHQALCTFATVEIRPKWDWKIFPSFITVLQLLCWNQTKMGLKVRAGMRLQSADWLKSYRTTII